jgi:polyisoprenoid-binding protein YceI
MRKFVLLLVIIVWAESISAQRFYLSNSSHVKFFSENILENITATNQKSIALIDLEKQEIAVKIPIKDFAFVIKKMEEHFKEDYLESNLFPYATFKGFFSKKIDLSQSGSFFLSVNGTTTIHGVSKMEILQGKVVVDAQTKSLVMESDFTIKLDDYNIKVPSIMLYKIAEKVSVHSQFSLKPITGKNQITSLANGTVY